MLTRIQCQGPTRAIDLRIRIIPVAVYENCQLSAYWPFRLCEMAEVCDIPWK